MKAFGAVLLLLLASCGNGGENNDPQEPVVLNIAVAANMQYAMDSIVSLFEAEENIQCNVTANASGMLTAQIEQGAPYDVFVSANMEFPRELKKKGFSKAPTVYCYGRLALVFGMDKKYETVEAVFADPGVKRVAIADPETAPYGIAAIEYLNNVGLFAGNKERIVYGESISQVNQYISTASVDAGFTSMSFLTKFQSDYGYLEIDENKYAQIEQGVSLLKHGWTENEETAQKFITFLGSEKCRKVLTWFGYRVP